MFQLLQLRRNKQLDRFFIRDFNQDPSGWAEKDNTFDAVVCCVSVQYMQQPERVFAEILRVLRPDGVCIVTFTSRLFSSKAIQAWRGHTAFGRVSLVRQYFQCIEGKRLQTCWLVILQRMASHCSEYSYLSAIAGSVHDHISSCFDWPMTLPIHLWTAAAMKPNSPCCTGQCDDRTTYNTAVQGGVMYWSLQGSRRLKSSKKWLCHHSYCHH